MPEIIRRDDVASFVTSGSCPDDQASVQLIAPGLGKSWFGSGFIPSNWTYAERYTYLWTELIPVLAFAAVGVLFWWLGRRTRAQAAKAAQEPATLA